VFVLDYDALVASHGRARWHDERKWLSARMPVAAARLPDLADEYLRAVLPLTGRLAKVLVVDLDNTLWGGVVGEDGLEGVRLGPEYPGAPYLALQRAILALRARGVILAVASKNNDADAMEVLERHPEMLLRPHHFAAMEIGWGDKAQSLRKLAADLNLGLDAFAFLDDSPVERDRVRVATPEVTVIDLPGDPMDYAGALLACPAFERLSVSNEDRERGRIYAEQRQRADLERSATTLEDFLRSLQMVMDMFEARPEDVPRIAQLTQKTNQFNLTTRRYSEQQVAGMLLDAETHVYRARLEDRFGDNGLVGVAITREAKGVSEIDTLLLSCRVIGRTVETAMLARLAADAGARGCHVIRGVFAPTARNELAGALYPAHGFAKVGDGEAGLVWEHELPAADLRTPDWIAARRDLAPAGVREEEYE
jgi:FkbH-like protein